MQNQYSLKKKTNTLALLLFPAFFYNKDYFASLLSACHSHPFNCFFLLSVVHTPVFLRLFFMIS